MIYIEHIGGAKVFAVTKEATYYLDGPSKGGGDPAEINVHFGGVSEEWK